MHCGLAMYLRGHVYDTNCLPLKREPPATSANRREFVSRSAGGHTESTRRSHERDADQRYRDRLKTAASEPICRHDVSRKDHDATPVRLGPGPEMTPNETCGEETICTSFHLD